MQHWPMVSVGVPVFNGGRYLAEALESLVRQDYPSLEIIVSDNASTDETWEICKIFVARYNFLRIFLQKEHVSIYKNSKFVLDQTTGKYFFWAHHDDWRDHDWVSSMVEELEKSDKFVAALGPTCMYDSDTNPKGTLRFSNHFAPQRCSLFTFLVFTLFKPTPFLGLLKFNMFWHSLFRKEVLDLIFFHIGNQAISDRQLPAILAALGQFRYVEGARYHRRKGGLAKETKESMLVRKKHWSLMLIPLSFRVGAPWQAKLFILIVVPLANLNNLLYRLRRGKKSKSKQRT